MTTWHVFEHEGERYAQSSSAMGDYSHAHATIHLKKGEPFGGVPWSDLTLGSTHTFDVDKSEAVLFRETFARRFKPFNAVRENVDKDFDVSDVHVATALGNEKPKLKKPPKGVVVTTMKAKTFDQSLSVNAQKEPLRASGLAAKVGDVVGFKRDVEYAGKVSAIRQQADKTIFTVVPHKGKKFNGPYLANHKAHDVYAEDTFMQAPPEPDAKPGKKPVKKFDPNEPRDGKGEWTTGGSAPAAHQLSPAAEAWQGVAQSIQDDATWEDWASALQHVQPTGFVGGGAFKAVNVPVEITKVEPDKQMIFGWASVVEKDGRLIIDKQDDVIYPEDLEHAAYGFVYHLQSAGTSVGKRGLGDMHTRMNVGRPIESMVFTKEKQDALGIDLGQVGWWVGFKVDDPELWAAFKRGERPEFSIGGSGTREDMVGKFLSFEDAIAKYNHSHDELGRFASGDTSGGVDTAYAVLTGGGTYHTVPNNATQYEHMAPIITSAQLKGNFNQWVESGGMHTFVAHAAAGIGLTFGIDMVSDFIVHIAHANVLGLFGAPAVEWALGKVTDMMGLTENGLIGVTHKIISTVHGNVLSSPPYKKSADMTVQEALDKVGAALTAYRSLHHG